MRMNRRHVKDTNDGSLYIFTTQVQATKSARDGDTTVSLVHGQGLFFSITKGTKVYFIALKKLV